MQGHAQNDGGHGITPLKSQKDSAVRAQHGHALGQHQHHILQGNHL
jgi:hypothetical protein